MTYEITKRAYDNAQVVWGYVPVTALGEEPYSPSHVAHTWVIMGVFDSRKKAFNFARRLTTDVEN